MITTTNSSNPAESDFSVDAARLIKRISSNNELRTQFVHSWILGKIPDIRKKEIRHETENNTDMKALLAELDTPSQTEIYRPLRDAALCLVIHGTTASSIPVSPRDLQFSDHSARLDRSQIINDTIEINLRQWLIALNLPPQFLDENPSLIKRVREHILSETSLAYFETLAEVVRNMSHRLLDCKPLAVDYAVINDFPDLNLLDYDLETFRLSFVLFAWNRFLSIYRNLVSELGQQKSFDLPMLATDPSYETLEAFIAAIDSSELQPYEKAAAAFEKGGSVLPEDGISEISLSRADLLNSHSHSRSCDSHPVTSDSLISVEDLQGDQPRIGEEAVSGILMSMGLSVDEVNRSFCIDSIRKVAKQPLSLLRGSEVVPKVIAILSKNLDQLPTQDWKVIADRYGSSNYLHKSPPSWSRLPGRSITSNDFTPIDRATLNARYQRLTSRGVLSEAQKKEAKKWFEGLDKEVNSMVDLFYSVSLQD